MALGTPSGTKEVPQPAGYDVQIYRVCSSSQPRAIPTVMRSGHVISVRDDAPKSFTYDTAKALDEHQELFRLYGDPFYYDTRHVADSPAVPTGALKFYRERGYLR
jgi:hypothetical protein